MNSEQSLLVQVEVTNTSDVDGDEVVQWYIHDHYANAVRPVKELKYFEKDLIKAAKQNYLLSKYPQKP